MILEDVQKLVPGNLVTLYELDVTPLGGDIERYHNHNDGIIVFQGKTYHPWAIEAKNFERTGEGQQPLPTLGVGNIGYDEAGNAIPGVVSALCLAFNNLVGANLFRHRTFAKYLDAVNFPGGNPDANPDAVFGVEKWIVSQKQTENDNIITFVLASPLQFDGKQLPGAQVLATFCEWLTIEGPEGGYRGAYCGYTGTAMFDKDGNPVTDPSLDRCGGRVSDCKKRFGEWQPLSFGSFPSADRIR